MREMPRPLYTEGDTAYRVIAACILLAAFLLAPLCMGDVVAVEPSPAVQTFFESDLGQVILAAIGTVASAAFAQFVRSHWLQTRTNAFTRKLIMWGGSAVAAVYTSKVRRWKANQPSGLSAQQKIEAENDAMALVRHAAAAEGYANHPFIKNDMLLRGAVVQAVAVAKAQAGVTRPTTKGG